MRLKHPFWLLPNLLSLDAPVVALLWQGFVAASFQVTLTLAARVTLGLAVWAVYIADRLLDTELPGPRRTSARHRFHQEHRTFMASLLTLALVCATALSILHVRPALLRAGVLTAAAVLVYLLFVHRARFYVPFVPKEIVVAFLFTCGTVLAPWTRSGHKLPLLIGGAALFFACFANTAAIEEFEWRRLGGAQEGPPHPMTVGIAHHYKAFCCAALVCCGVTYLIQGWSGLQPILLAVGVAILVLLMLVVGQDRLSPNAFRVLADAALLSPIPMWLLWHA